jgi:hypothetical protein
MLTETLTVALGLAGLLTAAALTAPTRTVVTEIDIPAQPEAVWAVLADGAAYPEWNPFIRHLSGPLQTGGRLRITVQPEGQKAMSFRPRVLSAVPGRELRWLGRLGLPRLFDGEHSFRLEARNGGTRLVHSETFRGLLLWVMSVDRFRADFTAMNLALHDRVVALGAVAGTR